MPEWISVKDHLPDDGQKVRIWANREYIATFRKGISEEDRRKMKSGVMDDPVELVWSASTGIVGLRRSDIYRAEDVFGNNLVPYAWEAEGHIMKGQEVTHWAFTSKPPAEEGHDMKCTGVNCPMQYPYDTKKCTMVESCLFRTRPKTNADKIRAMTDEELAKFIRNLEISGLHEKYCLALDDDECILCADCVVKWLQKPAEVDHAKE